MKEAELKEKLHRYIENATEDELQDVLFMVQEGAVEYQRTVEAKTGGKMKV